LRTAIDSGTKYPFGGQEGTAAMAIGDTITLDQLEADAALGAAIELVLDRLADDPDDSVLSWMLHHEEDARPVTLRGWEFRAPDSLWARWDPRGRTDA
jgi:hypothetical protein